MRIKIIQTTFDRNPIEFYEDQETKKQYARIFGGFAWPSDKPGFATVVSEEMIQHPSQVGQTQRLYVLDEFESFEPPKLLERCAELQRDYLIQGFYGRTQKAPQQMEMLAQWNRMRRDAQLSEVSIHSAPHSNDGGIFFHVTLLMMRLDPATMNIFGIAEKRLKSFLEAMNPEDLHKATDKDFPAVASLGYAVAALDGSPYDPLRPVGAIQAETEYDIFNHS